MTDISHDIDLIARDLRQRGYHPSTARKMAREHVAERHAADAAAIRCGGLPPDEHPHLRSRIITRADGELAREYEFQGANSWYWAIQDERGFHRQPRGA